jgi:hypothetical protein
MAELPTHNPWRNSSARSFWWLSVIMSIPPTGNRQCFRSRVAAVKSELSTNVYLGQNLLRKRGRERDNPPGRDITLTRLNQRRPQRRFNVAKNPRQPAGPRFLSGGICASQH